MPDWPTTPRETLSIGQLAALAGVSVRTLHHYDAIGLLSPGSRTAAGYRVYLPADVARLQRILFYRELEFPLDRIHRLIDDPATGELDHLRRQQRELTERIERLQRVREAVRTTMEAHQMSIDLTPEERLEAFGDHDPAQHEDEVRERWGGTEAYRESQRRTKRYSKDDWLEIRAEQEAIGACFAAAMQAGAAAESPEAMDVAERARRQIDERFYSCSHTMHCGLADLYVADARYAAHFDDRAEGLARYVRAAIHANAARHADAS